MAAKVTKVTKVTKATEGEIVKVKKNKKPIYYVVTTWIYNSDIPGESGLTVDKKLYTNFDDAVKRANEIIIEEKEILEKENEDDVYMTHDHEEENEFTVVLEKKGLGGICGPGYIESNNGTRIVCDVKLIREIV